MTMGIRVRNFRLFQGDFRGVNGPKELALEKMGLGQFAFRKDNRYTGS